ncbi:hypothetical protein [Algoriphagus boritolerans]|uniref:hypothetical protein n=1 Tax=Algoriphagus boritolerans TaxID=308111 RepID=UPI000AC2C38D
MKINLPAIGSTDLEQDDTLTGFREFSEGIITRWEQTKTYRGFFFRAEDYFGFVKRLRSIDQELKGDIVDFEKKSKWLWTQSGSRSHSQSKGSTAAQIR